MQDKIAKKMNWSKERESDLLFKEGFAYFGEKAQRRRIYVSFRKKENIL